MFYTATEVVTTAPERDMHTERWGKRSWRKFPSLRIKKQKPLCAANVPAIIFQVHYLLFQLSYSWTCPIIIDISKVRQQYKQPCCCLTTSPFKIPALLHDLSCCLGILPSHFQSGWLLRARERQLSLRSYHATQMHGMPPSRCCRGTVHEAAPSSQRHFSLAIAWGAEIQCWFTAESNLILVTLLPLSFEAVLVQDACTDLPSFT